MSKHLKLQLRQPVLQMHVPMAETLTRPQRLALVRLALGDAVLVGEVKMAPFDSCSIQTRQRGRRILQLNISRSSMRSMKLRSRKRLSRRKRRDQLARDTIIPEMDLAGEVGLIGVEDLIEEVIITTSGQGDEVGTIMLLWCKALLGDMEFYG